MKHVYIIYKIVNIQKYLIFYNLLKIDYKIIFNIIYYNVKKYSFKNVINRRKCK